MVQVGTLMAESTWVKIFQSGVFRHLRSCGELSEHIKYEISGCVERLTRPPWTLPLSRLRPSNPLPSTVYGVKFDVDFISGVKFWLSPNPWFLFIDLSRRTAIPERQAHVWMRISRGWTEIFQIYFFAIDRGPNRLLISPNGEPELRAPETESRPAWNFTLFATPENLSLSVPHLAVFQLSTPTALYQLGEFEQGQPKIRWQLHFSKECFSRHIHIFEIA